MNGWMRKSRGFAAGAIAVALLLALQLIVTSAVASQMQATNLLFGTAEGRIICLSDHSQPGDSKPAQLVHKTTCDICAFAAQPGTAPAPLFAPLPRMFLHIAEIPLPRATLHISERHEPRLTRGPPLDA
jgi:hypothetical protein